MNTITQQFNTIVEHPKFERRTFWMLVFLLSVLISTYGIFLGKTVVSVIERRVSESDMEKIVDMIDRVLMNPNDESIIEQVGDEVNEMMGERAIFVF